MKRTRCEYRTLAFSEFRGYESWPVVSASHPDDTLNVIVANSVMMKAYQSATVDVARVIATVLADPEPHLGRGYELTGPRSRDMQGVAREYSDAKP